MIQLSCFSLQALLPVSLRAFSLPCPTCTIIHSPLSSFPISIFWDMQKEKWFPLPQLYWIEWLAHFFSPCISGWSRTCQNMSFYAFQPLDVSNAVKNSGKKTRHLNPGKQGKQSWKLIVVETVSLCHSSFLFPLINYSYFKKTPLIFISWQSHTFFPYYQRQNINVLICQMSSLSTKFSSGK